MYWYWKPNERNDIIIIGIIDNGVNDIIDWEIDMILKLKWNDINDQIYWWNGINDDSDNQSILKPYYY